MCIDDETAAQQACDHVWVGSYMDGYTCLHCGLPDDDGEWVPLSLRQSGVVVFLMICVWSGLVVGCVSIGILIFKILQLAT